MSKVPDKSVIVGMLGLFGTGLALAAGLMLVPTSKAFADHNSCACSGTQCAGVYERWCCTWEGFNCGCTFFTSCP